MATPPDGQGVVSAPQDRLGGDPGDGAGTPDAVRDPPVLRSGRDGGLDPPETDRGGLDGADDLARGRANQRGAGLALVRAGDPPRPPAAKPPRTIVGDPRESRRRARAWRLAHAIPWLSSLPGVRVNPRLARDVQDTVDPGGAEAREIARTYPTPPFAADFKKRIRVTLGLRLRSWVETWACTCQWAEMRRRPPPSLESIAHRAKMPVSDLTQIASHSSLDEIAFLWLTVPPVMLRHYGFPEPSERVRTRRDDLARLLEQARQRTRPATLCPYLPWDDPETARLIEEQER